jgi:hypothetical protein
MENENTFNLSTGDRNGYDVEVFENDRTVWLVLDPNNSRYDSAAQDLTPDQARELAAALLRFADKAEA